MNNKLINTRMHTKAGFTRISFSFSFFNLKAKQLPPALNIGTLRTVILASRKLNLILILGYFSHEQPFWTANFVCGM